MDSTFGQFITKEYGLLRQILSYLKPRDLHSARLVCREWGSAVDSIIEKNPYTVICYKEDEFRNLYIPKTLIPDLVIQNHPKKCKLSKQEFLWCPCEFSHQDSIFISLYPNCGFEETDYSTSSYQFWRTNSLLILPSSSKMQVSTFVVDSNIEIFKQPVTDDVVNRCIGGKGPIKCLLIMAKALSSSSKRKWIDSVITLLIQRQGMTFALGGGDIKNTVFRRGYTNAANSGTKYCLTLIALRGEGFTAHSEILSSFDQQPIENVISEMGKTVGPVPENGSRVAFISQCIDRIPIEIVESSAFRRTFPDVPQFGFQAYGEFGFKNSSIDDSSFLLPNKKMKITYKHSHTTSIVILTFRKI